MVKQNTGKEFGHGSWWKRLFLNRRYRDVLFRRLFRDKKDLLELYNALNGSTYTDPGALEVVTLEDVIFMKMKNDLSFIIGSRLNLYEHQSSWNPNMPLRGLLYFARQFEGMISSRGDDLYSGRLVEVPTPVYIIFYNGKGMDCDRRVLCLSDAFPTGRGSGCLECTCEVLNINRGHNRGLMEKCRRLWEYSEFSSEIEENIRRGLDRKEAVEAAMDACIEKGILRDILIREKAEVMHMLLTEYDEKKHLRNTYREGMEAGLEKGRQEGLKRGHREGMEAGLSKGREEKLRELVEKKRSKGKTIPEIAEELEEDPLVIEQIIR